MGRGTAEYISRILEGLCPLIFEAAKPRGFDHKGTVLVLPCCHVVQWGQEVDDNNQK